MKLYYSYINIDTTLCAVPWNYCLTAADVDLNTTINALFGIKIEFICAVVLVDDITSMLESKFGRAK